MDLDRVSYMGRKTGGWVIILSLLTLALACSRASEPVAEQVDKVVEPGIVE